MAPGARGKAKGPFSFVVFYVSLVCNLCTSHSDCLYGPKYFVESGTFCNAPIVMELILLCELGGSLRLCNVAVEAC